MLRQRFTDTLKEAMKAREELTVSTVRLIIAKLKEQDIEARGRGKPDGIGEAEIQQMLQGMIKQRRDSIVLYEQGKRADLVAKEQGEIAVIERFLPQQMSEAELEGAVKALISEFGAQGMKDMGRVMAGLKERHAGRFDGGKASQAVKRLLG